MSYSFLFKQVNIQGLSASNICSFGGLWLNSFKLGHIVNVIGTHHGFELYSENHLAGNWNITWYEVCYLDWALGQWKLSDLI